MLDRIVDRITGGPTRFLLATLFALLVIRFTEAWYWVTMAMVIVVLALEWLRKEHAAVLDVIRGTAGQYQDADQGQCDE